MANIFSITPFMCGCWGLQEWTFVMLALQLSIANEDDLMKTQSLLFMPCAQNVYTAVAPLLEWL